MLKIFLLADDDQDDAELFGEALSEIDPAIHFHHVDDGDAVLEFLKKHDGESPDIIFLDLNMPGIDGWECLRQLKANSVCEGIPVIIYSTSSHQHDKDRAIQLGATGLITKPSSYRLLKQILHNIVEADKGKLREMIRNQFWM
mgnify:CR=1 FL=1